MIGFAVGALSVLTPFYFHALQDWDLADKTTLFPPEAGSIIGFYSQIWLVGGIVGVLLALAAVGASQHFKARPR